MPEFRFVDFHLTIDGKSGNYNVEGRGPDGSGPGPESFVLAQDEAFQRTVQRVHDGECPDLAALQAVGTQLFRTLLPYDTLDSYWAASRALPEGTRLRLKLNVRPVELAPLPWEALYHRQTFLAADRTQPLVRTLDHSQPNQPFALAGQLQVLHVQANPQGTEVLELDASQAALERALGSRGKITPLRHPTPERLREALRSGTYHILHYDGHAGLEAQGYLALHDAEDRIEWLSAEMLANYLMGSSVQLVVLAGCETGADAVGQRFTGLAQQLARRNVPAVVGMQYAIPDGAVVAFIGGFYGALREELPVEVALVDSRLAMREVDAGAAWLAPLLYLRVREGQLFAPGEATIFPVTVSPPRQSPLYEVRQRYLRHLQRECNVLPLAALGGEEMLGREVGLRDVYVGLDTMHWVPLKGKQREEESLVFPDQLERDVAMEPRTIQYASTGMGKTSEMLRMFGLPLTALEAATRHRRLVLLGDPGGGKSTFVRQLASELAGAAVANQPLAEGWEPGLLPLFVVLRDLLPRLEALPEQGMGTVRHQTLLATLLEQWGAELRGVDPTNFEALVLEALEGGKVIAIFDGLDEVPERARGRVRQVVQALLAYYPQVQRVIVTCRIRSYQGSATRLEGFTEETLAPFDEKKIFRFVGAWYGVQAGLTADQRATRRADLERAALTPDLRRLAENPMLLTVMTLIHQRNVGLPRERVRLYARAVEILLRRWQKEKGMPLSSALADFLEKEERLRPVLERLGYEAHRAQAERGEADLGRGELLTLLECRDLLGETSLANDFLDYVDQRAGLLVGRGGDEAGGRPTLYSFPHRTFQEYLAGCYMVRGRGAAREYRDRAWEGEYWHVAALYGAEELYYERAKGDATPLLDLAYDLCPPVDPLDDASWRAALWSGQMAALVGENAIEQDAGRPDGGAAYLRRLRERLLRLLQDPTLLSLPERAEASDVLAYLGDSRFSEKYWWLPGTPLLGFVEVPDGSFVMGSDPLQDPDAYDNELPSHQLTLPRFWIARYPVTVAQWRSFTQASGHEPSDPDSLQGVPTHPVVWINWHDALAYCRWLHEQLKAEATGRLERGYVDPFWQGLAQGTLQVTLPSEAQWEKAARGTDGRIYPWGERYRSGYANIDETDQLFGKKKVGSHFLGRTSAVGLYPQGASPYGCEEMSGNVWEWTRSTGGRYPDASGYKALPTSAVRVLRGGSWGYDLRFARGASRGLLRPGYRVSHWGFRVVASPVEADS